METILKYLKQPSTWQGLIGIVTGFGVAVSPELSQAIIAAGVALIGLISVIKDENKK